MKIYKNIADLINRKSVLIFTAVLLVISLIPIFVISPYGRATGDDLSNSVSTHLKWLDTHSVFAVFKTAFDNVVKMYKYWEGCYTSCYLYAVQPELFGKGFYAVVPFFNLLIWCGGSLFLFSVVLHRVIKLDKLWTYSISLLFWLLTMEFIPSTQNALFWWAGTSHYTVAFSLCLISFGLMILFLQDIEKPRAGLMIALVILGALIGGVNYQIAMLSFMGCFLLAAYCFLIKKNIKILLVGIPIVVEIIGFIISAMAPGNIGRGGEEMTFTASRVFSTVISSFTKGFTDAVSFVIEKPLMAVGMVVIFLLMILALKQKYEGGSNEGFRIRYPVIVICLLFCLYAAMEAPLIFAGVDNATRGVINMEFLVFYLVVFSVELILADSIARKKSARSFQYTFLLPGLIICFALLVVFRWYVKTSTTYRCFDYVSSGKAADFKEQMDEQTYILERSCLIRRSNPGDYDMVAYVGPINDDQGPLQHMPVTQDRTSYTNISTAMYYWIDYVEMTYDEEVVKNYMESIR